MNRLEPNILLAVSTGVALILLVLTASAFGEPGNTIKYVVSAVVCSAIVAGLNSWMARRMGQTQLHPMIRAEAPTSAVLAGLFPLAVIFAAAAPVFFPGHDYGLLVIIAAVWFGVSVDSALRARRRG
ncbi:hypothetical protein [uncultured Brevundimonas sp.]|uniref:hypothetical protein n=1 Tax=uncultured Brevundimonas sp. TaxID=213418 RepID=UPI002594C045|nr:hypothetical protein [uncultured Brevundimonas sp.]